MYGNRFAKLISSSPFILLFSFFSIDLIDTHRTYLFFVGIMGRMRNGCEKGAEREKIELYIYTYIYTIYIYIHI